ncbi:MAG: hypothetical protein WC121_11795 [Candidatus Kapaibacterium sp.]|jgi:hypothetical protein
MLDPTTLSAYASGANPAARAQAVRDSLGSGTLTVELRDGETLVYSGAFTGPMVAGADGSLSADVLLSGAVTTGGTPDAATWTCRIRNADGRYVDGAFGPGGRFTFSGGSLVVGQAVRLRVTIAAASWALAPTEAWATVPTISFVQGTAATRDVSQYLLSEGAVAHQGSLPAGVTFNPTLLRFEYDGVGASAATVGNTLEVTPFAEEITTFSMVSGVTGVMPFTFGHAFVEGDAPDFIDSDLTTFQADVKNRWPDGSVKFAVISGIADFTAGQARTISLRQAASATSGTPVSLAQLDAVLDYGSVTLELAPYGTVDLKPLVSQVSGTTGAPARGSPGLVRTWQSGPQCSEWHFYSPVGTDPHLAVWFHVRMFGDGSIEIETIVENGWSFVAAPASKAYTAALTINGSVRFAASNFWEEKQRGAMARLSDMEFSIRVYATSFETIYPVGTRIRVIGDTTVEGVVSSVSYDSSNSVSTIAVTWDGTGVTPANPIIVASAYGAHKHHTRWSREDWYGTDPKVTPRHDEAYFRSTRMIPNYAFHNPLNNRWTTPIGEVTPPVQTVNPDPFVMGDYRSYMGDYSGSNTIGWCNGWESLYAAAPSTEAYRCMIGNTRLLGRYSIHFRDETDGLRPLRPSKDGYQNLSITQLRSGLAYQWETSYRTPTPVDGGGPTWISSHSPSAGYVAYLATGRYAFLEGLQFADSVGLTLLHPNCRPSASPAYLNQIYPFPGSARGFGWVLRHQTQAYITIPDSDADAKATLGASLARCYQWIYDNRVANPAYAQNLITPFAENCVLYPRGVTIQSFMERFATTCFGMAMVVGAYPSETAREALHAILVRAYRNPVGMAGDGVTGWNYRLAERDDVVVATGTSTPGPGQSIAGLLLPFVDTWLASWKESYDANASTLTTPQLAYLDPAEGQSVYTYSTADWSGNSWMQSLIATLALAVDFGADGADASWRRMTTSTTFNGATVQNGFNNAPTWGWAPR